MSERVQYQFRDNNIIDKNDLLLNASLSEATTKEELIILKRCKEVINTLKKDEKDLNDVYSKIYDFEHNNVANNNEDELLELKKRYNKISLNIRHNERVLNSLREMRFIKRIESSENINYLKSQGYNTERFEKKPDNSESSHQQPTSEDLEQKYNEFLNKTITIKKGCEDAIDAKKRKYEINVEHIKQRKRKTTIGLAIIMAICITVLTFITGTYFLPSFGSYQHEELTNGKDVVCYVTNTGDCYHKINCKYLRSVNKTTMYQAEMNGYRPCSFCWNFPKAIYSTVTEINYFQKYGTIFAVLTCVFLIIFYIIYKREDKKIKVKIENEKSNFNKYKELLLAKVIDKLGLESDFDNNAKNFSGVPFDVEYHDGLPIAKDDRFKVYSSYYGKSYHKNPVCRGNNLLYELHIFQAMNYLCPCYFCATKMEVPIWHKKYIELHNLYKDILGMCK